MHHTSTDASLTALQSARITDYDFIRKPAWDTFDTSGPKEVRHLEGSGNLHVEAIIAAALIFLIIIAWCETLRLWISYGLLKDNAIIYDNAFSYLIYSVVITVLGLFILFLITS